MPSQSFLTILCLIFSNLSFAAGKPHVVSAFVDQKSQLYTVVCSNQRTLDGVTYNQLVATRVCEDQVVSEKPTEPMIKTIVYDYGKKQMTVSCAQNSSVFHLPSLKDFHLCEPQHQYKSFMDMTDLYTSDGELHVWAEEAPICLLNSQDHIVCKWRTNYFSGFEDENGKYQFTQPLILKNKKEKAGLAKFIGYPEDHFPPVNDRDPLQQLFNLAPMIAVPALAGETFENLRYNTFGTLCAIEKTTKILVCWKMETEYPAALTSLEEDMAKWGVDTSERGIKNIKEFFRSAEPVLRYRVRGMKMMKDYDEAGLIVTYASGKTSVYIPTFDAQNEIEHFIPYVPGYEVADADMTLDDEQIPGAIKHGFKYASRLPSPYLNSSHKLIVEVGYTDWDMSETSFFSGVYKEVLKDLEVLDFTAASGRFCYIEKANGQVACVEVRSGAG